MRRKRWGAEADKSTGDGYFSLIAMEGGEHEISEMRDH